MYPIYAFGSEEQREDGLPKMGRGEVIGCFGLSRNLILDRIPSGMKTRAVKQGNHYVLNGTKMWITHGSMPTWQWFGRKWMMKSAASLVEAALRGFKQLSLRRSFLIELLPLHFLS